MNRRDKIWLKKNDWKEIKPLGEVNCSSHDCEHDLHCFHRQRPIKQSYRNGKCFACGVDLIDWNRIDKKNLKDVDYTIQAIQNEMIRHVYWHKTIDENAMALARKKGFQQLREDAEKRISKYVSPAAQEKHFSGWHPNTFKRQPDLLCSTCHRYLLQKVCGGMAWD